MNTIFFSFLFSLLFYYYQIVYFVKTESRAKYDFSGFVLINSKGISY